MDGVRTALGRGVRAELVPLVWMGGGRSVMMAGPRDRDVRALLQLLRELVNNGGTSSMGVAATGGANWYWPSMPGPPREAS